MLVADGFLNVEIVRGGSTPLYIVNLKLWNWLPDGQATANGAMRRRHPDWFKADLAELIRLLSEMVIKPVITKTLLLAEA